MAMTNEQVATNLCLFIPDVLANHPETQAVELVDVVVKGQPPQRKVAVVLYHQDGLTLDHIAVATKIISTRLDEEESNDNDLVHGRYTLEVTSPGLDWPLRTARDFSRVIGRDVTIKLDSHKEILGEVLNITDQTVTIRTKLRGKHKKNQQDETYDVAYSDIVSAKQALPW